MSSYGPPGGPYAHEEPDKIGSPADPWAEPPADPWGDGSTVVSPGQPPNSPPGYSQLPYPQASGPSSYPQPGGYPQPGAYPQPAGYSPPVGLVSPAGYSPGTAPPANYPPAAGYAQPAGLAQQPAGYALPAGIAQQPPGYGWPPPAPVPDNRRQTVLIVIVVVLALLLGIGGFAAFLFSSPANSPTKQQVKPTAPASASPTGRPSGNASPRAASTDVRLITVDQCVVNDGTNDEPKMRVVECGAGTFKVLQRFDQTADVAKCNGLPGYTDYYYYDSPLDSLDFVLCLHRL